jgi:hypothetical protein
MFQPESEVEQLLFVVGGKMSEYIEEGLIDIIEEIVESPPGQKEILELFSFSSRPVAVLIEHENVFVRRLIEQFNPMILRIQLTVGFAGFVDQQELFIHVLDNFVELNSILY